MFRFSCHWSLRLIARDNLWQTPGLEALRTQNNPFVGRPSTLFSAEALICFDVFFMLARLQLVRLGQFGRLCCVLAKDEDVGKTLCIEY